MFSGTWWHVTVWFGSRLKENGSPPGSQEAGRQTRDRASRGVGVLKSPSKAPFVDEMSINEIVPYKFHHLPMAPLGNKLSTWSFWKTTKIPS